MMMEEENTQGSGMGKGALTVAKTDEVEEGEIMVDPNPLEVEGPQ